MAVHAGLSLGLFVATIGAYIQAKSELNMRLSVLLLLFILSACGPVLTTEFEIVPPPTENGRMCANNCLLMKDNCERACWDQQQSCEQMNQMQSNLDYLAYVATREAQDAPIKRERGSFSGGRYCAADSCLQRCVQNYNVCHTNCGGRVIPHTRCTAFCEQ